MVVTICGTISADILPAAPMDVNITANWEVTWETASVPWNLKAGRAVGEKWTVA